MITTGPHGSRSAMTCRIKCGNACDLPEPNTSGNRHIAELLGTVLARRTTPDGAAASAPMVLTGLPNPPTSATVT